MADYYSVVGSSMLGLTLSFSFATTSTCGTVGEWWEGCGLVDADAPGLPILL